MADRTITITLPEVVSDVDYARAVMAVWWAMWCCGHAERVGVVLDTVGQDKDVYREFDRASADCPWGVV